MPSTMRHEGSNCHLSVLVVRNRRREDVVLCRRRKGLGAIRGVDGVGDYLVCDLLF